MTTKRILSALLFIMVAMHGRRTFRGAHADAPTGQYTVSSDGLSVLDNKTGLRWERGVSASSTKYSWADAMTHCFFLNIGGLSGWRAPNLKELATLVDERHLGPAIDPTAFPGTPGVNFGEGVFWSSTPDPKPTDAGKSYVIDFNDGTPNIVTTSTLEFVRCVR